MAYSCWVWADAITVVNTRLKQCRFHSQETHPNVKPIRLVTALQLWCGYRQEMGTRMHCRKRRNFSSVPFLQAPCEKGCTPNHSLENSIWSGHGSDQIQWILTDNYASVIPVLCRRGWVSSSSIAFPVILDILGSASIDASASAFPSTTSEGMTALCIVWLATRKLPREMVGKPGKVLLLVSVFFWRLRCKWHIMIAERLQVFSQCLQGLTLTHLFWIGARTESRVG